MREKLKILLSSVSIKVLLIMAALVLPLNIIAIIYTNKAVNAIVEQAQFNVQKVADYHMQELGKQMDISRAFLTYLDTEDADCIRLRHGKLSGYDYESAKMKLYSGIKSMAEMTDGGDGYFYYYLDQKDGIVYGNAEREGRVDFTSEDVSGKLFTGEKPQRMEIYEWSGKKYLILLMQEKNVLNGSAIRLDPYVENVAKDIEYPVTDISMTEQAPEAGRENMISVWSGIKDIYLNIHLEKRAILKSVAYSSQIFWMIALLYLVLIPVLYMVLRKLLIRPLLSVNEAHRQIEAGNGTYRIGIMPASAEYRELCGSFNRMADHLNRLKIESYEKEISRQKMELRNLQLQKYGPIFF